MADPAPHPRDDQPNADGRVDVAGLSVDRRLHDFLHDRALPGTGVAAQDLWNGIAALIADHDPRRRALLAERERLQREIDDWWAAGGSPDPAVQTAFLTDIGYLVAEPEHVVVDTADVDPEIAAIAGPQLVVPVDNPRYAINAANARWGSLYDAFYGTDALGSPPPSGPYDPARGARVVAEVARRLDGWLPLAEGSHADVTGYALQDGALAVTLDGRTTRLQDPTAVVGHRGPADAPTSILLRHHGLHLELVVDREHPVGADHPAGLADVVAEAAISTIVDLEDSVAAVDTADKVACYAAWLGLVRGDLTAEVSRGGETFTRRLAEDRTWTAPGGDDVTLPGRSLLLVRHVGHLMDTDAVRDADGRPVGEGLLDAVVTVLCALHDLRGGPDGGPRGHTTRTGSVYVVKPKMHGPAEVALTDDLFAGVEDLLGLPRHTVKVGLMDEERRTSLNLAACLAAAPHRIAFINTGFLDRTGDEIHTAMAAGPVVRKGDMTTQPWMRAYERHNVEVGLAAGLRGRAQIGKGMWARPADMAEMLATKHAHPRAGASCAWVPSPTAAVLHATHYHDVDVAAVQQEIAEGLDGMPPRPAELLAVPLAPDPAVWSPQDVIAEVENNAQGILGYVVRWIQQGIGCSTVPDIRDVGLMEDRATCRISSQHIASWLRHGVVDEAQVREVFRRMAAVVDAQNADDPRYVPMAPSCDGPAFTAALELALSGADQPSGYTEPTLHRWRAVAKA